MLTTTENNNKTIINIHTINIHENQGKTNGKRNKTAPIIRPKKINKLLQKDDYFVNSLSNIPVQNYSDEISKPNNLRTFALKSKTNTSESSESNIYNNIHNFDLFTPVDSNDKTKLLIYNKESGNENIPNLNNNNNINKENSINNKMKEKEISEKNAIKEEDKKENDSQKTKEIALNQQQQRILELKEKIKQFNQMLKLEEEKFEKMKGDLNSEKNKENSSSNIKFKKIITMNMPKIRWKKKMMKIRKSKRKMKKKKNLLKRQKKKRKI